MSRLAELVQAIGQLGPLPGDDECAVAGPFVLPPATEEEIDAMRAASGGSLPRELGELLSITAGFTHPSLEWKPEPEAYAPDGMQLFLRASHYGNGDGFAIEPHGDVCRVWWFGHDSWFIVYWASSIESFLAHWLERARALYADDDHRFVDLNCPLHHSDPIRASDDPEVSAFLAELPRGSFIHDLRSVKAGTQIPYVAPARTLRRKDLLIASLPPPRPVAVEPFPISAYANDDLDAHARAVLDALPKGSLILHEKDLPPGGHLDTSAHPNAETTRRPPFWILFAKPKKPWWQLW